MYGVNKTPEQRALDFKLFLERKGWKDVEIDKYVKTMVNYEMNNSWYSALFPDAEDCLLLVDILNCNSYSQALELSNKCNQKYDFIKFVAYDDVEQPRVMVYMLICCPIDSLFEQTCKWMSFFVDVIEELIE